LNYNPYLPPNVLSKKIITQKNALHFCC